jgi:hypothetical protein
MFATCIFSATSPCCLGMETYRRVEFTSAEPAALVEKTATSLVEKVTTNLARTVRECRGSLEARWRWRKAGSQARARWRCQPVSTRMSWRTPRWCCGMEASKCWKPYGEQKHPSVREDMTVGPLGWCRGPRIGATLAQHFHLRLCFDP